MSLTLYFDLEFLRATIATLGLTVIAILLMRVLDLHDTFDTVIEGFKTMIEPLAIIFSAYMLKDVNGALGLTSYILEITQPFMTAQTLPFIVDCLRDRVKLGYVCHCPADHCAAGTGDRRQYPVDYRGNTFCQYIRQPCLPLC